MGKNKGKHKSERANQPSPVLVVQSRVAKALSDLRPQFWKIGVVIGMVAVILGGFSLWSWHVRKRDRGATHAFGKVMDTFRGQVIAEDQSGDKPGPGAKLDPNAPPKFKTYKEKQEATLAALAHLDKEYGGSGVTGRAQLLKAGLYYDLERYDEAITTYRTFLEGVKTGELAFVAREGVGYALEAKGLKAAKDGKAAEAASLYDQALAEYKQLPATGKDGKEEHADLAMYHQARVLALKGDAKGALALYQQVLDKFPGGPLSTDIGNRVALLEEQGS